VKGGDIVVVVAIVGVAIFGSVSVSIIVVAGVGSGVV